MKLTPLQLAVPCLIAISLTGVSTALYFLITKDDKDDNKKWTSSDKRKTTEIQVPRPIVPAVIGRSGTNIRNIQDQTGTQISFRQDDIENPSRTCIIKGSKEGIDLAKKLIENLVKNQPIIEIYETSVPHKICKDLIGERGFVIQEIQQLSSTKISIDSAPFKADPDSNRRVVIRGTAKNIATALVLIEDKVKAIKEAQVTMAANSTIRPPRVQSTLKSFPTPANSVDPKTEIFSSENTGKTIDVYVSAMINPDRFWIQVVSPANAKLDVLVNEMTAYYKMEENRECHCLKKIELGQLVAAKFPTDDRWYRGEVVVTNGEGEYQIYFVDYGDCELLKKEDILGLRTDFLSLRLQAIECCLAHVKPREGNWSKEACEKFSELTKLAKWKPLVAKIKGYKEREVFLPSLKKESTIVPCVDLFDRTGETEIDIGKTLIKNYFAVLEVEPDKVLQFSPLKNKDENLNNNSVSLKRNDSPDIVVLTPPPRSIPDEINLVTPMEKKLHIGPIELIDLEPSSNLNDDVSDGDQSESEKPQQKCEQINYGTSTQPTPGRYAPAEFSDGSEYSDDFDYDLS